MIVNLAILMRRELKQQSSPRSTQNSSSTPSWKQPTKRIEDFEKNSLTLLNYKKEVNSSNDGTMKI